jgi:hypothetical protein
MVEKRRIVRDLNFRRLECEEFRQMFLHVEIGFEQGVRVVQRPSLRVAQLRKKMELLELLESEEQSVEAEVS